MAEQKVWVGSVGPMLYDDDELIEDEDGDLSGVNYVSLATTGQLHVGTAPSDANNVLRMGDVGNAAYKPYFEGTITGTVNGLSVPTNVTINYVKIGRVITLTLPTTSGTSNANTFSISVSSTHLPPATQWVIPIIATDNGVVGVRVGYMGIGGTQITFQSGPGAGNPSWTTTGTKGFNGFVVTYVTAS